MDSLLLGMGVGLFAGLVPGAYSTVVATTALERGLGEGIKVSVIPAVTETTVMLVTVLVLTRLPVSTLRWIGMTGGLLLIFMAWKIFRGVRHRTRSGEEALDVTLSDSGKGHLVRAASFGLLAPGAWAFWFVFGAPLLLNRWGEGALQAAGFYLAFLACFVGSMVALAWAVASGRRYLNPLWHRRILRGASGLLVVVGGVLIWQSWTGNFTEMVRTPEVLEDHRTSGPDS